MLKRQEIILNLVYAKRTEIYTNHRTPNISPTTPPEPEVFNQHTWWDFHSGWKSTLNNLRLVIQPSVLFNFIKPWLKIFYIPELETGFLSLLDHLNQFSGYVVFNSE